ncbi:Cullin-4A [Drechslerella dactyloides]|uniref:Cullin-4A n=1 Tax=Drechslerella dactyloides TaxID=74499 RepID=A0AAD6J2D0_DREDA|nr:Cullin-4A [Drechslerella dactyloides]
MVIMTDNGTGAAHQASSTSPTTSTRPSASSAVAPASKKRKPSISIASSPTDNGGQSCKQAKSAASSLLPASPRDPTTDRPANPAKRVKSGDSTPTLPPAGPAAAATTSMTGDPLASSPPQPARTTNVVDLTKSSPAKPKVYSQPSALPPRNGRKIMVKNFKERPSGVPKEWVDKTMGILEDALTAVFEDKNDKDRGTSSEEIYRGCQSLCQAGKAPLIHERLLIRCKEHVCGPLRDTIGGQSGRTDEELVRTVNVAWKKWQDRLRIIQVLFFYFNQAYLYPAPDKDQILDMGIQLFSTHIITDTKFKLKFLNGIFQLYEKDRKGQADVDNSNLLIASIRILSTLGLYSTLFEPRFIDVSEGYYRLLAEEETESEDVARYAKECASQIKGEIARVEKFNLETTTRRDLIAIIEKEMILHHMFELTDIQGIAELIGKNDVESLETVYSVINRVEDAGLKLKPVWSKYIKDKGAAIVTDYERESQMVPRLLSLKHSLENILKTAFEKNTDLSHSLRESFETFINEQRKGAGYKKNAKPSEMIAKYMDLLLREGIKAISRSSDEDESMMGMGDEDVLLGHQLDQALDLFRFIHGKDVFEAFYKKDLARRLLMGRSASADAEKAMLSKLKTECGSGFTMNLEIMFKDIDISRDNMTSFKHSKVWAEQPDDMDLQVTVLSQAAWPTYPETTVTVPQNVAQYMEAYHRFYTSKHKGRKLAWQNALAHCVIKANFPKGKKELAMSAFQAVVLLLFDDDKKPLSYEYIKSSTSLADPELIRTLQSLACARVRPLTKHPKGKDINPSDTFTVNLAFTDPKIRIKINQIQLKETKEENTATHEQITQDRQYETQAAIIRIMKSRKTIGHNELIAETINQTKKRGVLDMADIKKNIERLIDKDYMERSENNSYTYVA